MAKAVAASTDAAFIALGLLSGPANQPRRAKIREMSAVLDSYMTGRVALRFVLSVPAGAVSAREKLLTKEQDLVLLDGKETPFRCGLKYVLWFDVALKSFPGATYLAAGDDDCYIQMSHFDADLRRVHAQAGSAPTLYGLMQWRSHYDNVTLDTSTGFMGWEFYDAQAMRIRRSMEACRDEVEASGYSPQRRAQLLAELLTLRRGDENAPAAAGASGAATDSPGRRLTGRGKTAGKSLGAGAGGVRTRRRGGGVASTSASAVATAFPRCAALSANEKRLSAILLSHVDWELPPFPVANGPLFAVSRGLASMLAADLALGDVTTPPRSDGIYRGPNAWAAELEATPLGRRWHASLEPGGPRVPELAKRRCWPNSDAALGLFIVRAALTRGAPLTLVNSPLGVQHYPWPVYSPNRGFSNRSIVFHGAKRNTSRAWPFAQRMSSGPFIPLNRTCGVCRDMGWVSEPGSALGGWHCCGRRVVLGKGGRRARKEDSAAVSE